MCRMAMRSASTSITTCLGTIRPGVGDVHGQERGESARARPENEDAGVGDELDGSDVLPDFKLAVWDIFQKS